MFVSVIFNTEYMDVSDRIKWFLKNLSHAKENDWLIITHEYLGRHFSELAKGCDERFYDEFEMKHINPEELNDLDIYYVPDLVFDELYQKSGLRTKMLLELEKERVPELEKHLETAIQTGLSKRGETHVEGIFNMLHCFESLRVIAKQFNCPLIPYTFTAIRRVHGYRQTLYMANTDGFLFDSPEAEKRYENFIVELPDFHWFSNKEILAMLGKERNLPLLGLMDAEPEYEVGVAVEAYSITPQCYCKNTVTDDDIYYACNKLYSQDKIISRVHPMKYDTFGIGRQNLKNDPISFLLSCKRIATVQSQLIVKAILWDRIVCVNSKTLPFAFLCETDYSSEHHMETRDINFLFFCYFIPSGCMFDRSYWRWRLTCPSEKEIFFCHLTNLLNELNLSKNIFTIPDKNMRITQILEARGCNYFQITQAVSNRSNIIFDYNYLLSKLEICYECTSEKIQPANKTEFCMNSKENGYFSSRFFIQKTKNLKSLKFYPFDGIGGVVSLHEIICNSKKMNVEHIEYEKKEYIPKNMSAYTICCTRDITGPLEIVLKWSAFSIEEYLLSK